MKMRKRTVGVEECHHIRKPSVCWVGTGTAVLADGAGPERGRITPAAIKSPILIVHGGPEDGAKIHISKGTLTMGSLSDNDIVVEGNGVSRRHAEIVRSDDGFYVRDLGVANQTFVNRQDIGEAEYLLHHGDRIHLADSAVTHVFFSKGAIGVNSGPVSRSGHVPGNAENRLVTQDSGTLSRPDNQDQDGVNQPEHQEALVVSSTEADLVEGTVHLRVETDGLAQVVIRFVNNLRLNGKLRLLRLTGNPPKGVEIWCSLREPVPFKHILEQMEEVAQVDGPLRDSTSGPEHQLVLDVRLKCGVPGESLATGRF